MNRPTLNALFACRTNVMKYLNRLIQEAQTALTMEKWAKKIYKKVFRVYSPEGPEVVPFDIPDWVILSSAMEAVSIESSQSMCLMLNLQHHFLLEFPDHNNMRCKYLNEAVQALIAVPFMSSERDSSLLLLVHALIWISDYPALLLQSIKYFIFEAVCCPDYLALYFVEWLDGLEQAHWFEGNLGNLTDMLEAIYQNTSPIPAVLYAQFNESRKLLLAQLVYFEKNDEWFPSDSASESDNSYESENSNESDNSYESL
jgi:hypothetical protein